MLNAWDVNDVCIWLDELGLNQYCELFRANEIDGAELANIDNRTLAEDLGMGKLVKSFLFNCIALNRNSFSYKSSVASRVQSTPDETYNFLQQLIFL